MSSIAMFMSGERLDQEHGMLNRLAVGLMNDGEHVTRVIPPSSNNIPTDYEQAVSIIPRIHTQFSFPFLQRKELLENLCSELKKQKTNSIVCFGVDVTKLGLAIAPLLDIPLYQEVISMRAVRRVKKNSPVTRWFAATPSLEQAIIERVGEDRAAFVPLGVTTMPEKEPSSDSSTKCAVVLNASDEPKSTEKILEALKAHPEIHIFLELDGKKDHKVWSVVEEKNMLDRTTCLQNVASLRSLIVQSDLVILPSSHMPLRTVLLEAMESGVPVLATKIEGFDMLVEGETALIVEGSWKEPMRTILQDDDLSTRLGSAATTLIATNYGSVAQIAALQAAVTPF